MTPKNDTDLNRWSKSDLVFIEKAGDLLIVAKLWFLNVCNLSKTNVQLKINLLLKKGQKRCNIKNLEEIKKVLKNPMVTLNLKNKKTKASSKKNLQISNYQGMEYVVKETGFYCQLCRKFVDGKADKARKYHCLSSKHKKKYEVCSFHLLLGFLGLYVFFQ